MSHYPYVLRAVPVELREQWDQFVAQHPAGHMLQSWGWGELKLSTGWLALRLALWDTEQQRIAAAANVLRYTASQGPLPGGYFAYIPKGPVVDWSQPGMCGALFSQLDTMLRAQGVGTLRMELAQVAGTASSKCIAEQAAAMGFRPAPTVQPIRTILLDLTLDEERQLAGMKEKWRYNVRLAGRKGVTVRAAQSAEDVQAWYRLLQATGERDQFRIHRFDYYLQAWRIFAPRNQAHLLLAEYDGQLLAGIFVGLLGKQAIYLYGASSNERRQLMANHLLQWQAMRRAKRQGATQYDLWGIPATDDEDEAMAGLYRFKRGWGGEVVRFMGAYEREYKVI